VSALHRLTTGIPLRVIGVTYALGAVFGLLAMVAGLPLGMLLGPMLGIAAASRLGLRPWGQALAVPQKWRFVFVPVVGVAIAAGFHQDFFAQARHWWVTMAALAVFVPLVQVLGYQMFRRIGGLSAATAYFAAMPGGFIESLEMGEKSGADMPMLIMLQFLRLILCIVLIPIGFSLFEGHAVGSAAGLSLSSGAAPLTLQDAALLFALGASGWFVAHHLRFPAAVLSGPLLFSAVAHATGLTAAVPPGWAILLTQAVMGTSLGVRLAGFAKGQAGLALRLAALNVAVMLALALGVALALAGPVGEPVAAVILAFAPGGVSEMSLVALSLHLSAVFVSLHHLVRIVLAVLVARLGLRLVGV